jgi:hypothetical protein
MMFSKGPAIVRRTAEGSEAEFDLGAGRAWSAPAPRGVAISCERGAVWITVEGDPEDHVVVAPGSFKTGARGRVAALALESARLLVAPA